MMIGDYTIHQLALYTDRGGLTRLGRERGFQRALKWVYYNNSYLLCEIDASSIKR